MTEDLKPCPFCGTNTPHPQRNGYYYCVRALWNDRPIEDALRARFALRTDDPPRDRAFLAERYPDWWVVKWHEEERGFYSVPGGYHCKVTTWMDLPEVQP